MYISIILLTIAGWMLHARKEAAEEFADRQAAAFARACADVVRRTEKRRIERPAGYNSEDRAEETPLTGHAPRTDGACAL